MALRNIGVSHEVVATAEVDEFAINSYSAIHSSDKPVAEQSEEYMKKYLSDRNIPLNNQGKLKNVRGKKLKNLYESTIRSNNVGDISKVDVDDIPDIDLMTYSFPCQDISIAGDLAGFGKDSGTRSSLLWEANRVIEHKLPKYLLMENVKNLVGKRFMGDFEEWIKHLEGIGYTNYWEVLNAKDYGVPQNRERVFMVSILGEHNPYVFPDKIELKDRLSDLLESDIDESFYLSQERVEQLTPIDREVDADSSDVIIQLAKYSTKNRDNTNRFRVFDDAGISPALDTMQGGGRQPCVADCDDLEPKDSFGRMGKQAAEAQNKLKLPHGETLNPFNMTQSSSDGVCPTLTTRPEGFKTAVIALDRCRIRKLIPLECWRLMGVADEDFYKAQEVNSNAQLYKQAGNAIVVDVMEHIFKNIDF